MSTTDRTPVDTKDLDSNPPSPPRGEDDTLTSDASSATIGDQNEDNAPVRRGLPNMKIPSIVAQSPLVQMGNRMRRSMSERFSKSVRNLGLFKVQPEEHEKLEEMLDSLTDEELKVAARASYEYLLMEKSSATATVLGAKTRLYAKSLAVRFLRSKLGNVEKALPRLQATLEFREEQDVDTIRLCLKDVKKEEENAPAGTPRRSDVRSENMDGMDLLALAQIRLAVGGSPTKEDKEESSDDDDDEEESDDEKDDDAAPSTTLATAVDHLYAKKCAQIRMELTQQLRCKSLYVHGFDMEGRSTYVFIPRKVQSHDPQWTLKAHLFTLERALACSQSVDKTVNAVVDFAGFSVSEHAPPTAIGQQFMMTFRNHYVGAVHRIFILNAPTTFWCLWSLFKPLVAQQTRAKILFVNTPLPNVGPINKKNVMEDYYEPEQVEPWMMDGGLAREFNVNEYLYDTPFDRAFDDPRLAKHADSEDLL